MNYTLSPVTYYCYLSPVCRLLVHTDIHSKCFRSLEKAIKRNPVPADRSYGGSLQRNRSHLNHLPTPVHLHRRAHLSHHRTRMDLALLKLDRSLTHRRARIKAKRRHPSLHPDLLRRQSNDLLSVKSNLPGSNLSLNQILKVEKTLQPYLDLRRKPSVQGCHQHRDH